MTRKTSWPAAVHRTEHVFAARWPRIAGGREITVTARRLSDQSPVVLHGTMQAALAGAATRRETAFISLPSGASHDAAHVAKHVATGMVFASCALPVGALERVTDHHVADQLPEGGRHRMGNFKFALRIIVFV